MRFVKFMILLLPLIVFISCSSQKSSLVVAEFDDTQISMDEFEKAYSQNSGGFDKAKSDSLTELKKFLDLYVNYKMKLRDAFVRGLNVDPDMKKELADYKANIGKTLFLQDNLYEPNLKKLYDRRKTEFRVSHIFLVPDSSKDEKQTLELGRQLIDRIVKGEDFVSLAKTYSKDSYTNSDGGDVYYVTAGQINIPAIEDALYKTEKGNIYPELVPSGFGFHILKVTEKQPRNSSVRVQHILIPFSDSSGTDTAKALNKIKEIEQKLKEGFDFGELAMKYSSDKGSAERRGDLGFFSRGQMVREFDEAAFKLNIGEVSPIVKTSFGFHLIKLAEIAPQKSYEEEKQELKEIYDRLRYKNDYKNLVTSLKTELNFEQNNNTFSKILSLSDTMKIGNDYLDSNLKSKAGTDEIFRIGNNSFSCDSLFNHMINMGSNLNMKVDGKILQDAIDEYSGEAAIQIKVNDYDKVNTGFAKLLSDYENGMYLFKILDEEVWSKISIDSSKIFGFWEMTKENYRWKDRVEFKEIHNSKESDINDCYNSVITGVPFDSLIAKYNQRLDYTSRPGLKGLVDAGTNELSKQANSMLNVGDVSKPFIFENGWSIVNLIKKDPARLKTFEEARAEAASILQEKESKRLEDEYMSKLKNIYNPKYYYDELQKAFK